MAKRKRLTPANPVVFGTAPEVKSMPPARAPIADVAADASATAALDHITHELSQARASGRMVLSVPLGQIVLDHLVRDRVVAQGDEDMQALIASINTRGQQTPIEVMELEGGGYGLISGWRRCQAVAHLAELEEHDGHVLALLRPPSDAYLAMVEENEIRVGLSYFERARIAYKSVQQAAFETKKQALLTLLQTASHPKRSKIRSFLPLVDAFDGALSFPHLIGERLGLRMAVALSAGEGFAPALIRALKATAPATPQAEQTLIETLITRKATPSKSGSFKDEKHQIELGIGITAQWSDQIGLTLSGAGVTRSLRQEVLNFVKQLPNKS